MKRVLVMVIVVLSVLSINVLAAGDIEVVGGVSFINLEISTSITATESDYEYDLSTSIKGNIGNELYGGIRYVLDNGLGFGAGYSSLSTESNREEEVKIFSPSYKETYESKDIEHIKLEGPYVEAIYKVTEMISIRGAVLFQNLIISVEELQNYYEETDTGYIDQYEYSEEYDYAKGEGLGYQIGAEINYPLSEDFLITGKAAYVLGSYDITHIYNSNEEELNEIPDNGKMTVEHSGFSLGFGINYSF